MSYYIESPKGHRFNDLPTEILVYETGWLGESKFYGEQPTVHRYVSERTCRISAIWVEDELEHDCREYVMHCESCDHQFGYILYNEDGNAWMHEKPKFCPICGRRVVE